MDSQTDEYTEHTDLSFSQILLLREVYWESSVKNELNQIICGERTDLKLYIWAQNLNIWRVLYPLQYH